MESQYRFYNANYQFQRAFALRIENPSRNRLERMAVSNPPNRRLDADCLPLVHALHFHCIFFQRRRFGKAIQRIRVMMLTTDGNEGNHFLLNAGFDVGLGAVTGIRHQVFQRAQCVR